MKPTILIKIGGALVMDPHAVTALWEAVSKLCETRSVVVVHGGGPRATEVARRIGHEPRLVHGRRITSDLDLEIVKWTMRGEMNVDLVAEAVRHGVEAVGISGADGALLRVEKRPPWTVDGETVDFGWVGDVRKVNASLIEHLLVGGYVPVVAPLGVDAGGQLFNVNADTVSCALASALSADEYLLVTESGGVRRDPLDPASHLPCVTRHQYESGVEDGWISNGMIVKLKVAFDALAAGVADVFVVSAADILQREHGTKVVK